MEQSEKMKLSNHHKRRLKTQIKILKNQNDAILNMVESDATKLSGVKSKSDKERIDKAPRKKSDHDKPEQRRANHEGKVGKENGTKSNAKTLRTCHTCGQNFASAKKLQAHNCLQW